MALLNVILALDATVLVPALPVRLYPPPYCYGLVLTQDDTLERAQRIRYRDFLGRHIVSTYEYRLSALPWLHF